ncbi:hypothetical protein F2Q69_00026649 [Brassica cretica]|uniref:Reverse transcriptase zinc-binding domain-containing protein n=1 Tax=Brassica cretica TaxID=69181 RepID=A0A8S9S7N1_BRACR|nr:hypothetical protein F2Q69_00026649 [Brassica cretica]
MEHLLVHCSYAKEVWVRGPWTSEFIATQDSTLASTLQASYLWKALPPMNDPTPGTAFTSHQCNEGVGISSTLSEWESAQPCRPPVAHSLSSLNRIVSNSPETVFCNSDAAWKSEARSAGLAWIFSNQANTELARASAAQDHGGDR